MSNPKENAVETQKKGETQASKEKKTKKLPEGFKPEEIILYPSSSEKSVRASAENVITFIVPRKATKGTVKMAVQALYGVKVAGVRTENAYSSGKKKAFVRLSKENSATELASKLGML